MMSRSYCVLFVFILFDLYRNSVICIPTLNGRYTRDIDNFRLTVPFRSHFNGDFYTFNIPHFFKLIPEKNRRKRSLDDPEIIHYVIHLGNDKHQALLWPNHGVVSPNAVSERHEPTLQVQDRTLRKIDDSKLCLYTGIIKGIKDSKVALSTCDGLAGYIAVGGKRFFIEPVQEHVANAHGQHLHVVYERHPQEDEADGNSQCGTATNWEDAWRKRFFEKYSKSEFTQKRSSESLHRYLETLVVCDKKFLDHHTNIDVETYVLTIMNMVAGFYHDYSSGNQMDVVVVRIIYLHKEEEEIDLVINPNAEDTLASFCKWQMKINPKDISSPNHHDIAVLLTRYDICSDNLSNCGLMGLAYVASACTPNEPCAINEDGGLVLGIVVAHEMGHVMGCSHDKEGESACPAQDKDDSYFVMAPFVHLYTTRWSTCSRGFITSLFENGLGDCLNDEPEVSLYKGRDVLPGVVYDADQQCKITFPQSTNVCKFDNNEFCAQLLCQTAPGSCTAKGEEPPADGTKCGENKWCYRKKCIEIGERTKAINGGWGKWGAFSECSRTCGGGVQIASRECDNPIPENGGRYCLGERKKVKICNNNPCPPGTLSYRDVQCQEHNSKPFNGQLYEWKGHFKEDEPCVLYCLSSSNFLSKLEPRAKDGTPCKPGTHYMCISGVCKKVGCDGEIDSDAVEDICGICNGDGTQCKIVDKTYDKPIANGYEKVAVIPSGSRNILIEELEPSMNVIAISEASGKKYFLNGNNREEQDGEKEFGTNVKGVYSHPEPQRESLTIHGPLTEDLVFYVVFYRPENVGYHYKYAEATVDVSYTPQYHWEQVDWEDCSAKCGGGTQEAKISCIEERAGRVADSFCETLDRPDAESKTCNEQPCKTKWKVGKWGKCHACRYKSGVRMREVECVKESPHPGTDDILVEDKECIEPKPGTRELCNSHTKCKTRRFTDGLPDEMMEDVWKQVYYNQRFTRDSTRKRKLREKEDRIKQFNKKRCNKEKPKNFKPSKLNVGSIVKDTIPEEEIKVIEVPLKQSHLSLTLSDNAFETMGDEAVDSIDSDKVKVSTGAEAAKILKKLTNAGSKNREARNRI